MVPNARFNELLADIEPSATTKGNASVAHTQVRNHLRCHPEFKDRLSSEFLAGSYARNTAIRPKRVGDEEERPDVDIIVVTTFDTSDDPEDVLCELCDALDDTFNVERVNKRSVRLLTPKAEIDVVPVVASGSSYQIPDRELGSWKETNPPEHNSWSARKNEEFGCRLKPMVKLFKWWRRENKTGKRPKGFALEVMTALHAPKDEAHYGEAFAQMLENIYQAYGALADAGMKPFIEDPGVPGNNIIQKVSITDWKNFIERVRVHAGFARRAQDTEDMDEATRLWRKLFGDRFKATATVAKAFNLGSTARASIAAATTFTFPNANAAPAKPRGFA